MKRTTAFVSLCLVAVILLTACGGGSSVTRLNGRWGLTSMTMDGQDYIAMIEELSPGTKVADIIYMEFLSDGRVSIAMAGNISTGTYKLANNELTIEVDGEAEFVGEVSGNAFSASRTEGGVTTSMTFTKIV